MKIILTGIVLIQISFLIGLIQINNHADICAKAINQEQYQIDVITQYIKGEK